MENYIKLSIEDQIELAWEHGTFLMSFKEKKDGISTTHILMWMNNFYIELRVKQNEKFEVLSQHAIVFTNIDILNKFIDRVSIDELFNKQLWFNNN
jgi:hypothetical protein